jgi:6-carboxyhexanoate--CoA ligase
MFSHYSKVILDRYALLYNLFMWSIRMRASKKGDQGLNNLDALEIHISGAEGLYSENEIIKVLRQYTKRALTHSRGKPDTIVLTVENIKEKPKEVKALPIRTVSCNSVRKAHEIIYERLLDIGIKKRAINSAFKILLSEKTMRGASLIDLKTGKRLEPDKERGVRVSRLGIEKGFERSLVRRLSRLRVHATTVKEALILASKVASNPDIIAEICISDDPDYTTGYIASKKFGYIRIPHIKLKGQKHGGRVFFINSYAEIKGLIEYLEKTPTIVTGR